MSHFSTAPQQLIETRFEGRGGQTQFSKLVAMEPASVSRYLAAASRPDVEALEQICSALEPAEVAQLVVAYLRDDVPPAAAKLVRIISLIDSPKSAANPEPAPRPRLPKKLQSAFEFLMTEAEKHPVVADSILSTVALLKGQRL